MKNPLKFGKIIPTPTMHAWAQAYNAGNLIAVLSLSQPQLNRAMEIPEVSLPMLGKDLINTLEAEYFTLETKNLTTIKQALASTIEKVPDNILVSFCVSVIIENIVYLYLYGPGKIIMKRKMKIGVLLEQKEEKNLIAGSGYIEDGDVILLETQQFTQTIPVDMVTPFLEKEKLSEMAETLSPLIHEKQVGGAAAIAFSYSEDSHQPIMAEKPPTETISKENEDRQIPSDNLSPIEHTHHAHVHEPVKPRRKPFPSFHFSHTRKLILTIVIIVAVVLVTSIFFSAKKHKEVIDDKVFQQTVPATQRKYDEAQSLIDLNKSLAREDFQNAKNILNPAVGKYPPESKENKQITALMQKIDTALAGVAQSTTPDAKQVDNSVSPLLAAVLQHASAKYATQDDKTIYLAGNDGVTAVTKSDSKENVIIKNNSDWKSIGGFETYLGNFYLLDKSAGILKYVPAGSNYSKSNYFSGTAPDLSKATGMAIDGSIWIVSSDGTIMKYTRGKADDFTIKGLDKPMNNPSQIYTSLDTTNIYVLDNGNKRVVVLDKNGNFLQQYQAGAVGQAVDFQVLEQQKKIYIAAAGKIWEIDTK